MRSFSKISSSVTSLQANLDSADEPKVARSNEQIVEKEALVPTKIAQEQFKSSEVENIDTPVHTTIEQADSTKNISPTTAKQVDSPGSAKTPAAPLPIEQQINLNNGTAYSANPRLIENLDDLPKAATGSSEPTTIERVDSDKENFKVSTNSAAQTNLEASARSLMVPMESPILQQKSAPKTDGCYNSHNSTITSTPLKISTGIQNFDTCNWYSTQSLQTTGVFYHKDDTSSKIDQACKPHTSISVPNTIDDLVLLANCNSNSLFQTQVPNQL